MKVDQRSPLLEVGRELRRISGPVEPKSAAIGMEGKRAEITPYQAPVDLEPSPALSLVGEAQADADGTKDRRAGDRWSGWRSPTGLVRGRRRLSPKRLLRQTANPHFLMRHDCSKGGQTRAQNSHSLYPHLFRQGV
jgi:hypothetical protein